MNSILWKTAGALALGLTAILSAHATSGFYFDDFDRPNSATIGPDWVEQKDNWDLVDGTVRGSSANYAQAIYTGLDTGQNPYVVQIDATTIGHARWVGLIFNVDPDNPTNFYVFVIRGASDNPSQASAAQFRRYVNGVLSVRNDVTQLFDHTTLTRNHYWRYRVVSREPGVFHLTILRLDQVTREPVEVLWEKRVEDTVHAHWGGQAGLYGNSDFRIDNFLAAHHEEVRPVDLSLNRAVEIEFLAESERFYQPQVLDDGDWINHGSMILGRGAVTTVRLPREDPEQVRILTSPE